MDQVLGQPWVDYVRDRLYVASRDGSAGTQNSLWFLDIVNSGNLLKVFSGADFTTGPSQSADGNSLWIGDEAGVLHIVDLAALTKTTNSIASGTAFKGFIWEDFNIRGRLYFVTTDGNVWCLADPVVGLVLLEDEAGGERDGRPAACRATRCCGWAAPTAPCTS